MPGCAYPATATVANPAALLALPSASPKRAPPPALRPPQCSSRPAVPSTPRYWSFSRSDSCTLAKARPSDGMSSPRVARGVHWLEPCQYVSSSPTSTARRPVGRKDMASV